MSRRLRALALLVAALAVVAPLTPLTPPRAVATGCEGEPAAEERLLPRETRALLALARALPLETRIGQLLIPGFVGTEPDAGLLDRAARDRVGGLFLLARNVRSEEQLRRLTAQLDDATAGATGGLRPFLATDFEGGIVNALRAITGNTPSAAQLAARGEEGVEAQGIADAAALRWLGLNTDLAPVADVLTAPSGVIGTRSFSSAAAPAAALSRAYLRGLRAGGVLGVMKHFPGHGATSGDSHVLLPLVDRSLEQLWDTDLLPYRQAVEAQELQAVMMGHLSVPAIDPEMPTSISRRAVGGLLRGELGFDGLVMTDELKMRAISERYGVIEAALLALEAGVDVVLADWTGSEQDAVFRGLIAACRAGELSSARVDWSVARVLRLKLAYGLAAPAIVERYDAVVQTLAQEDAPASEAPESMPAGETEAAPAGETEGAPPEPSPTPMPTSVPAPAPTSVSTQPTPASIQPTPAPPTPTMSVTPSPSPSPSATRTATATRTPAG
ncbi:MAG TPA: glycoside hydrolase family 3 N-terminal domain-containing protein [Chloroflexota bacterium]|nr:glycoside hydrolase family 3 N-terminal domain-containing protein [Chloroflexota bacterium]